MQSPPPTHRHLPPWGWPSRAPSLRASLLPAQGVTEYEPRVLNQLVDFVYKYTADVLQDAEVRRRFVQGGLPAAGADTG